MELVLVTGALCMAPSGPICPLDTALGPSRQHESPRTVRTVQEAGPGVLTSLTAATWGCHTEGAGQHVVREKHTGEDVLSWATSCRSRVVTSPHGDESRCPFLMLTLTPALVLPPQAPKAQSRSLPASIRPLVDISQAHTGPGTLPL